MPEDDLKGPNRTSLEFKIASHAFWMLLAQLATMVSALGILIAIGRLLGPEELGRWRFAQVLLSYLVIFVDTGFNAFTVREIARGRLAIGRFGKTLILLRLGVALTFLSGTLAALALLKRPSDELLLVAVVCSTALPLALNLGYVMHGLQQFRRLSIARLVSQVAGLAVGLVTIVWFQSLLGAALAVCLSAGLAAVLVLRSDRVAAILRCDAVLRDATYIWRRSLPFVGAALANQLASSVDAFLLLSMRGERDLGLYTAPFVIAGASLVIGGAVISVAYPRIAAVGTSVASTGLISDVCAVMGCISVPIAVGGVVLAKPLLSGVFGMEYAEMWPILCALMMLPLIGFMNMTLGQTLAAIGAQRSVFRVAVSSAVLSVVFNIFAIANFGAMGAALVAVLVELVALAFYWRVCGDSGFAVPVLPYLGSLPAAGIMGVALLAATDSVGNIGLLIAVGLCVYVAVQLVRPSRGFQLVCGLGHSPLQRRA